MSEREVALPIGVAEAERRSFLQAYRRLLLGICWGLVALIILAIVGIFISKTGVGFILPLLGLLVLVALALVTVLSGSLAWLRGAVIPVLAVVTALISRYFKRINSHLCNIASGIIYPLNEIDFVRGDIFE